MSTEFTKIAKTISDAYLSGKVGDPSEYVTKVASKNNLNARQIERISNKVNRKISVGLTKKASRGEIDPHYIFPTVKTANIIAALTPKSSASPTEPPKKKLDISSVFDVTPSDKVDLTDASPMKLVEDPSSKIKSKEIALCALSILNRKLKEKRAKIKRMEIRIENLLCRFEKMAARHMLNGAPIQAFEKMPETVSNSIEKVANKVEDDWGVEINSVDYQIEVDRSDDIFKVASDIALYESDRDEATEEFLEVSEKIDTLKDRL